jgi:hypothetical protein
MSIEVTRGKKDSIIERIIGALGLYEIDHPGAVINIYRQNSVSVRVRVIDTFFRGLNRPERSDLVWKYLEGLTDDDQSEISTMLLLTPDETERSFANFEFENPVPSKL